MFWANKVAKEIIKSGKYQPFWVDDMFTPSGFAHTGSLRGPLVHDLVFRALLAEGVSVKSTYVLNDFDPIDGLPPELADKFSQYLGYSLRLAPSPEEGYKSFGEYFTADFQKVLRSLGVAAQFFSSWDMYHEGKFNGVIREALDSAEKIQDIYQKVSGSRKREKGWLPLQVTCEKCQKLGTTRVHGWNGKTVKYTCEPSMVTWAKGCGYTGEMSPFDGNGKLPWKVDWAAHWKVMGVTVEGAGKDHSSAGGSRDIAKALCEEVFHIPNPYNLPYEFFLIGGKKMSSSKGLGLKARDLTKLIPAEIGRFLFTRTDYRQAIEFDPVETMAIPDLFDEYDRCWNAYITGSDENLSSAYVMSQINKLPPKKPVFLPRFRDVANYLQLANVDLVQKFTGIKGEKLLPAELDILHEREKYAKVWLANFAPSDIVYAVNKDIPEEAGNLNAPQKEYLSGVGILLEKKDWQAGELQQELYQLSKKKNIPVKEAFAAIYLSLIGKTHGPKAAWFLLDQDKKFIIERFKNVQQTTGS